MQRQIIQCLLVAFLMQCMLPYAPAQSGEVPNEVKQEAQNTNPPTENTGESRFSVGAGTDQVQNWDGCQRLPRCNEPRSVYRRRYREYQDDEAEDSRAMWRASRRRRHALIGAIIGFGIGAAIGAKGNKDQHTRARVGAPLLGGAIGALIGAAIGGAHP